MFRQGCVKARFSESYSFSYGSTSSNLGSVSLEENAATAGYTTGNAKADWRPDDRFGHSCYRLFNPCTINGIRCQVAYSSVTPLEACSDVSGGWISSYGASISPNVDVNVYYIGRNGGYTSTEQLILQYQTMVQYGSDRSDQYIVLGFHEPISKLLTLKDRTLNLDAAYVTKMETAFGSHLLNLNKEIRARAAELTYRAGVYNTIDGFDTEDSAATDRAYVEAGNIPRSFYDTDLYHPNEYGCKAFAMLIHDKMVKLGYLDDAYILSTGADL